MPSKMLKEEKKIQKEFNKEIETVLTVREIAIIHEMTQRYTSYNCLWIVGATGVRVEIEQEELKELSKRMGKIMDKIKDLTSTMVKEEKEEKESTPTTNMSIPLVGLEEVNSKEDEERECLHGRPFNGRCEECDTLVSMG